MRIQILSGRKVWPAFRPEVDLANNLALIISVRLSGYQADAEQLGLKFSTYMRLRCSILHAELAKSPFTDISRSHVLATSRAGYG